MCEKPVQVARLSGCFSGPKVRLEDTSAGDLGHSPSAISVRPPGTSGAPNRAVRRRVKICASSLPVTPGVPRKHFLAIFVGYEEDFAFRAGGDGRFDGVGG